MKRLQGLLMGELYGGDEDWVRGGELVGLPEPVFDVTAKCDMVTPRG